MERNSNQSMFTKYLHFKYRIDTYERTLYDIVQIQFFKIISYNLSNFLHR